MSHVQVLTLLLLTLQSCDSQGRLPFLSPFFFLCNYHRQQEAVGPEQGEVAISVSIEGNPQFYTPGQLYGVYIRSSSDFDGFLLTGLYTTASGAHVSPLTSPMAAISGSGGPHQGVNYMCSMIHSHLSRMPQQNLSFMWMAPPKGTGCVSFLATASLGQQVLFKDITAFQLCERGDVQSKPPRPKLTTIHSDGMVLREDFESGQEFDSVVWSSTIGGELSDKCGIVMYRNSAVFCHTDGDRVMVTNPLNTTTAVALQFALTPGSCRPSVEDEPINIYFASNDNCSDWTKIDKIRAPDLPYTVTHIIHLPTNAQKHGVCFKWQQARSEFTDSFGGCWAMDNVLISNTALTPTLLQEDFDPIDPSLWLFFPGSMIKMGCKSDGSAMIFGNEAGENMATTRDMDLSAADISDIILEQTFEDSYLTGWHKEGSFAGHECGVIHEGKAMVFAHAGPRNLCTPYMDMTTVGSVRFYFAMGTEPCSFGNFTDGLEVLVYSEDKRGHTRTLDILPPQKFRKPKLVSLPLDLKSKKMKSRICWIQKKHGGLNNHIWSIDSIQLLPRLPSMPSHYVQFGLNMNCGTKSDGRVKLEFSTDRGDNWYLVHQPCLPGRCPGQHHTMSSVFKPFEISGWQRVTVPLPYAALTSTTRLRWRQVGGSGQVHWGIDTVFIGPCSKGCGGHGYCKESGCICDFGYSGDTCEETTASHPTSLVEMLSPSADQVLPARFMSIQGATLSYACGVVASGKALVFNGDEMRKAETVDLNTTLSRYLQFSLRIGSESPVSACLSPDRPDEAVILDVSCNGGIMWDTMKMFTASHYTTPRVEFIHLLPSAIGPSCRFRWWQPNHSGHKLDIWALDDISLTSKLYNTISLDVGKLHILDSGVKLHLGEIGSFCGKLNAVRFVKPEHQEESRSITTNAVHIGPSHEVEFELVLGCGQRFSDMVDNSVVLEYSTDHGMNWNKVVSSCLPPQQCPQYQSDSKYSASEFRQWKRVVVPLPAHTWSVTTMLRLHQAQWTPGDSWAVGHLYVGQQCPELCSGHGNCFEGVCRCDPGYSGETCQPIKPLKTHLHEDFSRMGELHETWEVVLGGEVVPVKKGCGTILSGESLHFSQAGSRILSTHDMDTRRTDFLEFYLRIGGSNLLSCQGGINRENSVLLQYSLNGGITWELLKELQGDDYRNPKLVHIALPVSAKAAQLRYRWWQPYHGGLEQDQWAIDQISLDTYTDMPLLYDDFERFNVYDSSHWLTVTEGMLFIYCQSASSALVLNNQDNPKFAITKRLKLAKGDVVQFKINVGCSRQFAYADPVYLRFSHDSGKTWQPVIKQCYLEDSCQQQYREESQYYTGTYGEWRMVVVPLEDYIVAKPVQFQWLQGGDLSAGFALDDLYIGQPCPEMCSGQGVCRRGTCDCFKGFREPNCTKPSQGSHGEFDRFDNMNQPSALWDNIHGGQLGAGCGVIDVGKSLYFYGDGTREAKTVVMDISNIKMLQFDIRIGSNENTKSCRKPARRNEGVIVEYSTNNGITWHLLRSLDPFTCCNQSQVVNIQLPDGAKSKMTSFRWWQALGTEDEERAQWSIDSIVIGINETTRSTFQDDFSPMQQDVWFMAQNAVPRLTCDSKDLALEFSKTDAVQRYAETWDFHVMPSSFLQFDLAMGCGGAYSSLYHVMLEFSKDMGRTWHPVVEECLPPDTNCVGYHLSSVFSSESHTNWTRVTMYLPANAVSPATRFRWLQQTTTSRGNIWALDNVYLGDGCAWMCSGHGYCRNGHCVCDQGYFGEFCVPQVPLPGYLKDSFDGQLQNDQWPEIYGGEVTNICGVIQFGNSLTFYKDTIRLIATRDLDASAIMVLQFVFQYGCNEVHPTWSPEHSVLLQYSTNGGVSWQLLKELFFVPSAGRRFFSITNSRQAMSNSTRFRFWQPKHGGYMQSVWSIDSLYIGGAAMHPTSVYETFDSEPDPALWLFWPGGRIGEFCADHTGPDTPLTGSKAIVYKRGPGEKSITTNDMEVGEKTVVQFDINVGCSIHSYHKHPVYLQYSKDGGLSWLLVVPPCKGDACAHSSIDGTVFYSGTSKKWRRIIVPLAGLKICGTARFRWYQGYFGEREFTPEWSLDNVYIGNSCRDHCSGHGTCVAGVLCQCDDTYDGSGCETAKGNPKYLKDDFNDAAISDRKWVLHSGGELTKKCGQLVTGNAFHTTSSGVRGLVSRDLDLTQASVVQFTIKRGCSPVTSDPTTQPVLLQYSTNGGISWTTMEAFSFNGTSKMAEYVALPWPEEAREKAVRVRWWQPSSDGTYRDEWALDDIFIGGNIMGEVALQDDFVAVKDTHWLTLAGGQLQTGVCHPGKYALQFSGEGTPRFAVTSDIVVRENTFVQFELAMGCNKMDKCYGIHLEYSLDMGKTWSLVASHCLPSSVDCVSFHTDTTFPSDVFFNWKRVILPLPYYTRSRSTRLRWVQEEGFDVTNTWALAHVYIGNECPRMCTGHGRCSRGQCSCDNGWRGQFCEQPTGQLPKWLKEDMFDQDWEQGQWSRVSGGFISTSCRVNTAGKVLHFIGGCTRQLTSTDLDLSEAVYIQFHFVFGCLATPEHRDEGVIVDYSTNGGIIWTTVTELYYDQYKKPEFVSLMLPEGARRLGTRIRWWQPKHSGENTADWAVDNIVIGGTDPAPGSLKENFNSGITQKLWLNNDNMEMGNFCGELSQSAISSPVGMETVTLTTVDMNIEKGHILQFSISVGCNATWDTYILPVLLQFSVDFGVTWHPLVAECAPSDPQCTDVENMESSFYNNLEWRKMTYLLEGEVISRSTRFRWLQHFSSDVSQSQVWAVDNVYIGPACPGNCRGHGWCDYPRCNCFQGYGGKDCRVVSKRPAYLKETFSGSNLGLDSWRLVQGGTIGQGCPPVLDDPALVLRGKGQRQVVTVDLDTRNARFIQFLLQIGGEGQEDGCGRPQSRTDSVILQYSANGGTTWHTLQVLDHSSFTSMQRVYIPLPGRAATAATQIRWWQPISMATKPVAVWSLDNIFIGGSAINPSELWDEFGNSTDLSWEFSLNGEVQDKFCGKSDLAMTWSEGVGERHITTGQLIVQENYMLQFQIAVGCDQLRHSCNDHQSIRLEYNKDPRSNNWNLVQPVCLPGHISSSECSPYSYSTGSIYTANEFLTWKRVTLDLPKKVFSSSTRFRWVQTNTNTSAVAWALDDVYIGEKCPEMCGGRGFCLNKTCQCDDGNFGRVCQPSRSLLLSHMSDNFDESIKPGYWPQVDGGGVGYGCGPLHPLGHGSNLYFNGCGLRQAITAEMDTTKASKIMFVLQIGSQKQTDTCNIKVNKDNIGEKSVILQYSKNKGLNWMLLASHDPRNYLSPKRVSYDIPTDAKVLGMQFRWWQPLHDGKGHDQWAIDSVEIIMTRQDEMLRDAAWVQWNRWQHRQRHRSLSPG